MSREAHEDAKTRMVQAGATPINVAAVIAEWTPEFTSDERQRVNPSWMRYASMAGLATQHLVDQLTWLRSVGNEGANTLAQPRAGS